MTSLIVSSLRAGYGGAPVLQNVSFELENGRIMGVLGANGSGKTTLLKAICGILPHDGSCLLDGTPLEGLTARQREDFSQALEILLERAREGRRTCYSQLDACRKQEEETR